MAIFRRAAFWVSGAHSPTGINSTHSSRRSPQRRLFVLPISCVCAVLAVLSVLSRIVQHIYIYIYTNYFLLSLVAVVEFLKTGLVCLLRSSNASDENAGRKQSILFLMNIIQMYIITLNIQSEWIGWNRWVLSKHWWLKSSIFLGGQTPSRKTKLVCISLYCTTGPNKCWKLACNWPECTVS